MAGTRVSGLREYLNNAARWRIDRAYDYAIEHLPDEPSLHLQYLKAHGRLGNFRNPLRFNEKIQARKLNEDGARFTALSDKIRAKDIVAEKLGSAWVTPTLWHGASLPARHERDWPKPYVLKANHGCGWNIFVYDGDAEDWAAMESTAAWWLAQTYGVVLREKGYFGIVPQLLVEPLIGDPAAAPADYKLFCFHGRVAFIQVITERHLLTQCATLDRDWRLQPVAYSLMERRREVPEQAPPKPTCAAEMIAAAELLSRDFDFVRVDLYDVAGAPRFGEMTFYPGSGYNNFDPQDYEFIFGALWNLPNP